MQENPMIKTKDKPESQCYTELSNIPTAKIMKKTKQ